MNTLDFILYKKALFLKRSKIKVFLALLLVFSTVNYIAASLLQHSFSGVKIGMFDNINIIIFLFLFLRSTYIINRINKKDSDVSS